MPRATLYFPSQKMGTFLDSVLGFRFDHGTLVVYTPCFNIHTRESQEIFNFLIAIDIPAADATELMESLK